MTLHLPHVDMRVDEAPLYPRAISAQPTTVPLPCSTRREEHPRIFLSFVFGFLHAVVSRRAILQSAVSAAANHVIDALKECAE